MRRVYKSRVSKTAFTLLEMVLVVAIIVILASALMLGVTQYIEGAKKADNLIQDSSLAVKNSLHASEQMLQDKNF